MVAFVASGKKRFNYKGFQVSDNQHTLRLLQKSVTQAQASRSLRIPRRFPSQYREETLASWIPDTQSARACFYLHSAASICPRAFPNSSNSTYVAVVMFSSPWYVPWFRRATSTSFSARAFYVPRIVQRYERRLALRRTRRAVTSQRIVSLAFETFENSREFDVASRERETFDAWRIGSAYSYKNRILTRRRFIEDYTTESLRKYSEQLLYTLLEKNSWHVILSTILTITWLRYWTSMNPILHLMPMGAILRFAHCRIYRGSTSRLSNLDKWESFRYRFESMTTSLTIPV